jgi:hypothetical protein
MLETLNTFYFFIGGAGTAKTNSVLADSASLRDEDEDDDADSDPEGNFGLGIRREDKG